MTPIQLLDLIEQVLNLEHRVLWEYPRSTEAYALRDEALAAVASLKETISALYHENENQQAVEV